MNDEGKSVPPDVVNRSSGAHSGAEIPSDKNGGNVPVTGRNMWDAAIETSKGFGRYLPWVIIVAGLAYGWLKFSELQRQSHLDEQKARADAENRVQGKLDAASKELHETYEQIAKMNKQELDTVAAMLRVHDDAVTRTEEQRTTLNKLHAEAEQERETAKKARADTDRAIDDAGRAAKQLEEERKAASDASAEFERQRKQKLDEIDRKTSEVNQKAAQFGELNRKLVDLATRVTAKPGDKEVIQFATDILDKYSPAPEKLLASFQKHPSDETAKALHNLIGLDPSEVDKAVKRGLGFAFWQRLVKESESAFVGVQDQTTDADLNVVVIIYSNKVTETTAFPRMVCVEASDTQDWNQRVAYNVFRQFGDKDAGVGRFVPREKSWILSETLRETPSEEEVRSENIYGTEKRLPFVTLEILRKEDPDLAKSALDTNVSDFSAAMTMIETAKHFDPSRLLQPLQQESYLGIREAVNQLLTAAIKHESPAGKLAPASTVKADIFGRIAATVLKPGIHFVELKPRERSSSSSTESGQSQVRSQAALTFEYDSATKEKKSARLTLARENPDGQWLLANFEDPVAFGLAAGE